MGAKVMIFLLAVLAFGQADVTFILNSNATSHSFAHFWEGSVGSCHAATALREDWRQQMRQTHNELGTQRVRFHGILDDDMSVLFDIQGSTLVTSFIDVFSVFDFLLSIDMAPIIEVSFMPRLLISNPSTVFYYEAHTCPPRDYGLWSQLLQQLARALINRYGIATVSKWPFEIWNEPNCGFWSGTMQDYWTLLENSWVALKAVDSRLLVGGPATCQVGFLNETLAFARAHGFGLDFLSTHFYPTDYGLDNVTRDGVQRAFTRARAAAGAMPLYITEFNDGLWDPGYHDEPYAAAFLTQTACECQGLVDLASWWTFSDIFEEGGLHPTPFNHSTDWGMLTVNGVAKPVYRAAQLLHTLGSSSLSLVGSHPTVGVTAVPADDQSGITFVLYNHDIPTSTTIAPQTVSVVMEGRCASLQSIASLVRIDSAHCNAEALWIAMGEPTYPTSAQVVALQDASAYVPEQVPVSCLDSAAVVEVSLPVEGVAFVTVLKR